MPLIVPTDQYGRPLFLGPGNRYCGLSQPVGVGTEYPIGLTLSEYVDLGWHYKEISISGSIIADMRFNDGSPDGQPVTGGWDINETFSTDNFSRPLLSEPRDITCHYPDQWSHNIQHTDDDANYDYTYTLSLSIYPSQIIVVGGIIYPRITAQIVCLMVEKSSSMIYLGATATTIEPSGDSRVAGSADIFGESVTLFWTPEYSGDDFFMRITSASHVTTSSDTWTY